MSLSEDPLSQDIEELLGPGYLRQSYTDLGIPPDWHENWDILRTTLEGLKETGMDPYDAILGLLHVKVIREESLSVDSSSVDHLKHHLGTNYVPSQEERTLIAQFCSQGNKRMARISDRINAERQKLMSWDGRYVALYELIKPYRDLISPMRSMPPEILQEIFMACLPTEHYAIMHTSQAPLLFGRVCSSWRSISLSTPTLWSSIHMVPSAIGPLESNDRFTSLRTWLHRSGNCPLWISIAVGDGLKDIVDTLLAYSRRWVALKLVDYVPYEASAIWSLTPEEVPLLEVFEFVEHAWYGAEPMAMAFLSVPRNLRSISITSVLPLPSCSWAQITALCLRSRQPTFFELRLDDTIGLLSQCVNLQSCELSFPPYVHDNSSNTVLPSGTPAPAHVTLPHLTALSLTTDLAPTADFNINQILDRLVLPCLAKLRLEGSLTGNEFTDMLSAVDQLVSRSSCDIRKLFIVLPAGHVDSLLKCLRRLSRLVTLELRSNVDYGLPRPNLTPFLQELVELPSLTPLCPSLRYLKLSQCDDSDADQALLAAVIKSRCSAASAHRLKAVHIALHSIWEADETIWELQRGVFRESSVVIHETFNVLRPDRLRWEGVPMEDPTFPTW
ncbi:hypothetical protein B0H16DRAFT_1714409 [Mycena metata]|uniref:F-box domain-containing protein n=1 Tax=Mycena metata TaxID=1033252 RepID=A0AAD7JUL7_9AGAR|nr:hypothetical protein B0H16DRAFT_1714409 [Mycena metata]